MKRFSILLLLALLINVAAMAQSAAIRNIQQMAREDNRTMQHLDILCNRIGGRPAGSNACENAEEWAVKSFQDWGLEVKLEKAGQMAVGFNRGGWWGRMMGEEQMTLHFATPSYTSGTKGPQKGHVVIEPRTQAEFDRMKGRLKGAWVLVEGKSRGWALKHDADTKAEREKIRKANEEAMQYNSMMAGEDGKRKEIDTSTPALFYDEMVAAGVLGFIQAAPVPITALYDTEVVKNGVTFENLPTVPDIKLDEEQYARIYKMAKERRQIELEFDIRNHFHIGPVDYHNVIATIKGTKHPDEYVIVGAHLDSFDVATGGVDCGSGVSVVMEAARMIAQSGAKPDRTIIFILFAAEEFGLYGSQAWVEAHADLLPKISNMFNRDGGPMPYSAFSAPASLVEEYKKIAEPICELYPDYDFTVNELKPRPMPTRTGGNDASSFDVKGVPTLQMNEWRDVKGYGFDYREIWHTERDTYQKSIPEYQEQAAGAMALMVLGTANLKQMLPRDEVYRPTDKE
ncbi:MAG: Zn-dependent exopeptidase M28 [Alistipes sp.]|nr:Zn-dependent exopeptidase M28 [Alistipes sp.]